MGSGNDALNTSQPSRYAIIFNSRIFSLGEEVEFEYDWGKENGGKVNQQAKRYSCTIVSSFKLIIGHLMKSQQHLPYCQRVLVVTDLRDNTAMRQKIEI